MITIEFKSVTGAGLRHRVIEPALLMLEWPYLIVSATRTLLDTNWGDFPDDCKMTLQRFMMAMQTRTLDPNVVIVFEEMLPAGWKRIDPWIKALPNEVWTINRTK